eukprot:COSAG04_NODE_6918_length_1229_cov_1.588496_2_plen_96_part_01
MVFVAAARAAERGSEARQARGARGCCRRDGVAARARVAVPGHGPRRLETIRPLPPAQRRYPRRSPRTAHATPSQPHDSHDDVLVSSRTGPALGRTR